MRLSTVVNLLDVSLLRSCPRYKKPQVVVALNSCICLSEFAIVPLGAVCHRHCIAFRCCGFRQGMDLTVNSHEQHRQFLQSTKALFFL